MSDGGQTVRTVGDLLSIRTSLAFMLLRSDARAAGFFRMNVVDYELPKHGWRQASARTKCDGRAIRDRQRCHHILKEKEYKRLSQKQIFLGMRACQNLHWGFWEVFFNVHLVIGTFCSPGLLSRLESENKVIIEEENSADLWNLMRRRLLMCLAITLSAMQKRGPETS